MPMFDDYPGSVAEVLRDRTYNADALRAVKRFRRSKAWRGSVQSRKRKFRKLHRELCEVYRLDVGLRMSVGDVTRTSGSSHYSIDGPRPKITLVGKLSVVTYLHEFGHALGCDERRACDWSINLFRRCFPRSFASCMQRHHMLIQEGS